MDKSLLLQSGRLVIDEEGGNSENDAIHAMKERHFSSKTANQELEVCRFLALSNSRNRPFPSLSHILALSRPFREIMFARSLCSLSRTAARSTSVMSHVPAMAFSTDMKVDPTAEKKVYVEIDVLFKAFLQAL